MKRDYARLVDRLRNGDELERDEASREAADLIEALAAERTATGGEEPDLVEELQRSVATYREVAEHEQQNRRDAEADLREERRIVARIWKQLGSPTYSELGGRTIFDLIDDLKARVAPVTQTSAERLGNGEVGE
jgi:hypothetical protein